MEMDMRFLRKLPVPKEIKERFPVDKAIADIKAKRDEEMKAIFDGKLENLYKQTAYHRRRLQRSGAPARSG